MGRIIGIAYRMKETAKGEARPTLVAILDGGKVTEHQLETEDNELDFSRREFPISWRDVTLQDDISSFKPHHCKWKKVKKDEALDKVNPKHLRKIKTERGELVELCVAVPVAFEGLQEGDQVAMALGAGNMLAGLLFVKGKKVGASVHRIPPNVFKQHRPDSDKGQDHKNLAQLFAKQAPLFYQVRQPDKELINVAVKLDLRQQAQRERIAYGNRLRQSLVGITFLSEEEDVKGLIEAQYEKLMVSDVAYQALDAEEIKRTSDLEKAVHATAVWSIFEGIEGVGPRIAAGILAPIGDIRRFMVPPDFSGANTPEERAICRNRALEKGAAKLMKFCGVHVLPDGRFPRRRSGEVANWSPAARQALYLLADQFNRRPASRWGQYLLTAKARFRQKHPEPIEVEGTNGDKGKKVKRYTDGHILRMAKWRTLTRFVRWMYKEWARIEK